MRVIGVALFACSVLVGSPVVCAQQDQKDPGVEVTVLYNTVTVTRSGGDVLSESMRWHVFVGRYGDPGFADPEGRDYYEDIVPTPGQPPASPSWQPGDRVTYIRRGTDGQYTYTRETTYERQGNGSWGMPDNIVKKKRCEGTCPSVF